MFCPVFPPGAGLKGVFSVHHIDSLRCAIDNISFSVLVTDNPQIVSIVWVFVCSILDKHARITLIVSFEPDIMPIFNGVVCILAHLRAVVSG